MRGIYPGHDPRRKGPLRRIESPRLPPATKETDGDCRTGIRGLRSGEFELLTHDAHAAGRPPKAVGRRRLQRVQARFPHDQAGIAALELALVLPLLALIFVASVDFARFAARIHKCDALAQAAAAAIMQLPTVPAPVVIPSANGTVPMDVQLPEIDVMALVPLPAGARAASRLFWGCAAESGVAVVPQPICSNGERAAAYAEVSVAMATPRLLDWPDIALPAEVHARSLVRIG